MMRIICQTVRRITNEILRVKELRYMGYFLLLCIEFDWLLLIKKQIELKVMSFRECHSISSVKLNCYALDV